MQTIRDSNKCYERSGWQIRPPQTDRELDVETPSSLQPLRTLELHRSTRGAMAVGAPLEKGIRCLNVLG